MLITWNPVYSSLKFKTLAPYFADSGKMNTKAELNEQIKKYEAFLNETLRGDLLKVTNLQEELVKKLSNYEEIRQFVSSIKSGEIVDEKNCIKTQVDLGCNFYCQAKM